MLPSSHTIKLLMPILLIILFLGCSNSAGGLSGSPAAPSIDTKPTGLPPAPEEPAVETGQDEPLAEPVPNSKKNTPAGQAGDQGTPVLEPGPTSAPTKAVDANQHAHVLSVEVKGDAGNYSFSVGIQSPDTGCGQYADWWEVIDMGGGLIYRRILAHSHADEQPFTRSGGPVAIEPDTQVIVRAHMNNSGYGGAVYLGSISSGFEPGELEADFAIDLEGASPLPDRCAF